jgi:predicted permease
VLAVGLTLRNHGYDADRGRAFIDEARLRIARVPGVTRVSTTRQAPLSGTDWSTSLEPWTSTRFAGGADELTVGLNSVGPDYFELMGIPIVRGRALDARDTRSAEPVAVIDETLARELWGGADPIGRTIPLRGEDAPPHTVIGVARNATYYDLGEEGVTQLYVSADQSYQSTVVFLAATAADPLAVARAVRAALASVDPDVAIDEVTTLAALFDREIARVSALARVGVALGALALLLAGVGLYGLLSAVVASRSRDIGVRLALGATRQRIGREVLRHGLGLTLVGVTVGVIAALAVARVGASLLFEVRPYDPVSFVAAPLFLVLVAALALAIPARRAMRIDLMDTMRAD